MRRIQKIVIAPNAFKGTLTAAQAALAIERGLRQGFARNGGGRDVRFVRAPVADGGDGFAEVIMAAVGGRWVRRRVQGPVGERVTARFGMSSDGRTAAIEMARASGLALVRGRLRPLDATSRGTGELIQAALDRGVRRVVVGIGGSASTDGGMGIARALGVRFLDGRGRDVPEGGRGLMQLAQIVMDDSDVRMAGVKLEVACDVANPLYGKQGAAYVFGPQKGATQVQVRQLDRGLQRLAEVIEKDLGVDVAKLAGGGAAGGTGGGLVGILGARLRNGFEVVAEAVGLRKCLQGADLVITGEGRLDGQTARGKAPAGVLKLGRELGLQVVALCGSLGPGAASVGFDGVWGVSESVPGDRREAARDLEKGAFLLAQEWVWRGE